MISMSSSNAVGVLASERDEFTRARDDGGVFGAVGDRNAAAAAELQ
jgi:hypothetical protein